MSAPAAGDVLDGPGVRLAFVRVTGEELAMEAEYRGDGPMPPMHLHPAQDERFVVLSGAMLTVIGGVERRYEAGEDFVVRAGVAHQMAAQGPTRLSWTVIPPLRTAEFFAALYGGAAAADPAAFLAGFAGEFRLVPQTGP